MRINRFLARAGVASRRKAEELVLAGKVSVNGKEVTNLATEVNPEKDKVKISGKEISLPKHTYLMLNKPTGYTVTKDDPYARHTIFELLPKDHSLFPVGRLDRNTSGLILITNDGDFAQNIIHPRGKVEKEYIIRTRHQITEDTAERLLGGLELEDGFAKATKAEKTAAKELSMTIEMGRKRIVKRMIAALGNEVVGLARTRIGTIKLDTPLGRYRELTEKEIKNYV